MTVLRRNLKAIINPLVRPDGLCYYWGKNQGMLKALVLSPKDWGNAGVELKDYWKP
jgi:hypothetical protein